MDEFTITKRNNSFDCRKDLIRIEDRIFSELIAIILHASIGDGFSDPSNQ